LIPVNLQDRRIVFDLRFLLYVGHEWLLWLERRSSRGAARSRPGPCSTPASWVEPFSASSRPMAGRWSRIATTILQALRRPPSPPLLAGTLPAVCAASLYPALGPANGKCGRPGPGRGQSI